MIDVCLKVFKFFDRRASNLLNILSIKTIKRGNFDDNFGLSFWSSIKTDESQMMFSLMILFKKRRNLNNWEPPLSKRNHDNNQTNEETLQECTLIL